MSKIEDLIKQYCPNGSEWKRLGDVCSFITGFAFKSNTFHTEQSEELIGIVKTTNIQDMNISEEKMVYVDINAYPKLKIDSYLIPKGRIVIGMSGTIKIGVNNNDTEYLLNQRVGMFVPNESVLSNAYLKHLLHMVVKDFNSITDDGSVKNLSSDNIKNFQIPIPPLPIQEEIVRILDKFTELEKELEKELEMRKKQYEFYRDKLLTFGDDVERKRLGDVCILSAGGDAPKTHMSKIKSDEYKYPIYSNGIGDNALYGYTYEYKISSPCVTVAARGTIGWAALRTDPFYPIVRLICVLPKDYGELNVAFLKYFIDTIEFSVPEGGIPQLTVPMLKNLVIPVPSLQEQQRIVEILDTFDTLTTDLTQGLPAEIKMRRMQYEYYRDYLFGLLK